MSSKSRVALAILAVLGMLGLGWFLTRTPATSSPASAHELGNPVDPATNKELLAQGTTATERASVVPRDAGTEETAAPASAVTAPASLRHLSGTLKYFDPYGAHRTVPRGSFRLQSNDEEAPHTVLVEQGGWAVDFVGDDFEVDQVVAEGNPYFLHTARDGYFEFPPDGKLDLLVRRDHGCRLVVVDARDGRELSDVEVVRDGGRNQFGKTSPDGSAADVRVADHAASPVELTLARDRETYFVRSPGFAWRATYVHRKACGDHIVALRPGGDLSVSLGGDAPPKGAELRVRLQHEGDDAYAVENVDHRRAIGPLDREFDFPSIEAGSYEVSVEVGTSTWKSARIAAKNCAVSVGEHTRIELDLPTVEPAELVKAAGTLRGDGWPVVRKLSLFAREAPRLGGRFEYKPTLTARPGPAEGSIWSWSCDAIEPGAYSGFIEGPSWYFDLTIDPVNRDDYVIVIPPVAHVRLRVIDAERGGPAGVGQVGWLGYTGEWRPGGMFNPARFVPEDSTWRFDAAAGSVRIWLDDEDYEFRNVPMELVAGDNDLELRIAEACGITLTFTCGGVPVARDLGWEIQLAKPDGAGAGYANPLDGEETELKLKAPAPGKYRISAQGLDGYRIVSALDVTVPARGFARVVVELERAR